jgi:dTDP-4-dehydrorhamnose reductase
MSVTPIELWGGVECTVNRVRDSYRDQIYLTGHQGREDDLDRFAKLGIKSIRYPVLWERTAPEGKADWRWSDRRLHRLRELAIVPIVGLLHHGSGPKTTSLIDPDFPRRFSEYAGDVAQRYPWIENYVPINEPLTTARFSCLYGHWYPHKTDAYSFARALLFQCQATVLAMRAIREVNSDAQLIQTEDLGKTFSSPVLRYQADFDNSRRWLTWDLLSGRFDSSHAMWEFFRRAKISERDLMWFQENPCTPNILGINHYVTSDRYIDEDVQQHPGVNRGGNGRHRYTDVEAVRVLQSPDLGLQRRIAEAWARYHMPIAITESHLGCIEAHQQLLWFHDAWQAARLQQNCGVNLVAVTSWALLGAYDWDSLLTENNDHYERGAFELRNGQPEATPLANFLRTLGTDQTYGSLNLHNDATAWWKNSSRFRCPPISPDIAMMNPAA